MRQRRFPSWTVKELEESFLVQDATGQALAYLYFDDEPSPATSDQAAHARRSPAHGGELRQAAGAAARASAFQMTLRKEERSPRGDLSGSVLKGLFWYGSAVRPRGSHILCFVGDPDCRCADHSSVLHSLFQFLTFDKGLSGLDRGELVGHSDVVGIVGRLVHGRGRYALRFLDRRKIVVDFPPSFVVRDSVSDKHSRHL
jgi:hypothetical protein